MKCALCGCEFEPGHADVLCTSCGMGKRCGLVRCPRCHYETPAEPGLDHEPSAVSTDLQATSLAEWPIGVRAEILHVKTEDRAALRKLIAMGAIPPAEVFIRKKFPSYVLDIGNGRFSMDKELAGLVFVRKPC